MNGEDKIATNPQDELKLKLPQPEVPAERPWADDVLYREELAKRLTNLIRTQSDPFTLSIHGNWGTGKTFLLKRWQKDLEIQTYKAIYFNAWEDDFCDDPLVAILGQLSDYFKSSRLKDLVDKVTRSAMPLIRQNMLGILRKYTGVTLELDRDNQAQPTPLDDYISQRATKDTLKEQLAEFATAVAKETGHPTIFIIDELDRCRPSFAIELLERVKHIFDVPNLVFVFGINRDELQKALQSIYGDIDADTYLRRFFDIELTLPKANSEFFARNLIEKFRLYKLLAWTNENREYSLAASQLEELITWFPALWTRLGLSLRDIDYCVRLISLVGKNMEKRESLNTWVLGLLITLKIRNLALYQRFVGGGCHAAEVVDYVDGLLPLAERDHQLLNTLTYIEVFLYRAEDRYDSVQRNESPILDQLKLLRDNEEPTRPEYLSQRTKDEKGTRRIKMLIELFENTQPWAGGTNIGVLAGLIELHQGFMAK